MALPVEAQSVKLLTKLTIGYCFNRMRSQVRNLHRPP